MNWSTEQKIKAIEREIAFRKNVYPKRVAEARMTQAEAEKQISIFEAIAEDYHALLRSGGKRL